MKTIIMILKFVISSILIYNIPSLLMAYAFTGKSIHIIFLIVFLYSLYSLYSKKRLLYLNLIVYSVALAHTINKLISHIGEYGYTYNDYMIARIATIISFLILIVFFELLPAIRSRNKGV